MKASAESEGGKLTDRIGDLGEGLVAERLSSSGGDREKEVGGTQEGGVPEVQKRHIDE